MQWWGLLILTREVPWDNLPDDADWFATRVHELGLGRLDNISLHLICPPCEVANTLDSVRDLSKPRTRKRLAVIKRFERSDLVRVLLEQVGELVQEPGTGGAVCLETPGGGEGFSGGLDCDVDICFCPDHYLADGLARRGINHPVGRKGLHRKGM